MRLEIAEGRRRFARARVLRLATTDGDGRPHCVPATFALDADTVVMAVDNKPKRHQELRRLRNIRANPVVSLLVDHYDEDWRRLWWVRADGRARILPDASAAGHTAAVERLVAKYPQYAGRPPRGPVTEVEVVRWTGWAYTGGPGRGPDSPES
ncbi:TIGR03668 family PPOX class F420-dependent oxidoreductase [Streptomyces sp. NA02950]|uniref:TIGR03668 family PPOX class F420-dependent oxidoreductase n=1 Tax=Streptomyces sp. NA02950 TaxID=2742137 RepID=UPI0015908775|nr:TIGR03668 family PPOX class F420-dependent oxidoreductase [Streptomyces sp. NA02950]QKV92605.1 TIGR03668 family PPOX class F420-dependent oxidoreductase [Streptomyces sp. NA02950]